MSISRKNSMLRLDLDPERYILSDDLLSFTSNTFAPTNTKFARLRYGQNKELIFNIQSQILFLLDYFERVCQTSNVARSSLDVVDSNGQLQNLRQTEVQFEYASKILKPRDTYILVCVELGTPDVEGFPTVNVLLSDSELLTPKFLARVSNATDSKLAEKPAVKKTKKRRTPTSSRKSSLSDRGSLASTSLNNIACTR